MRIGWLIRPWMREDINMNAVLTVLIGIFGGIISGLFGVGGGLIFVPLLILLKNLDPHVAVGTSLAVVVPTAMMGVFAHGRAGMIDWKAFLLISAFAILGAWIGSQVSLRLDTGLLRKLLGLFLVVLAVKMFFTK